jgi:hypothetical protein
MVATLLTYRLRETVLHHDPGLHAQQQLENEAANPVH